MGAVSALVTLILVPRVLFLNQTCLLLRTVSPRLEKAFALHRALGGHVLEDTLYTTTEWPKTKYSSQRISELRSIQIQSLVSQEIGDPLQTIQQLRDLTRFVH